MAVFGLRLAERDACRGQIYIPSGLTDYRQPLGMIQAADPISRVSNRISYALDAHDFLSFPQFRNRLIRKFQKGNGVSSGVATALNGDRKVPIVWAADCPSGPSTHDLDGEATYKRP
jgi:hypothetical protein